MQNSRKLISDAITGIRPERTPVFDLLRNDAVIEHFAGRALDGADDEAVCLHAVSRALDATRGRQAPRIAGHQWQDDTGNILIDDRWTCWLKTPAFSDLHGWAHFIARDCEKIEHRLTAHTPDEIAREIRRQQQYNARLDGTVFLHCTPSTAVNAALFGYHCGLEYFTFLWVDHRDLLLRWLSLIARDQLQYVEKTAHPQTSCLAMIYSDIAFKGKLMFSRPMLQEMHFFDEVTALCAACHQRGLKVIFHSDGYIMDILDDLVAAGIDGLNPLEKAAGMDIFAIRRQFPQLILVGGLDVTNLLRCGSAEEIRAETRQIIDKVGAEGRLLIGSSTEIDSQVPLGNYLGFRQEVFS